ncbi:MAG: hypothetical protein IPQ08_13485 [Chitinophagaceae bacterium]|nr:hypothetical protein [Chitinophagaceae bacterium]
MRSLFLSALSIILLFTACQKEIDWSQGQSPDQLLVKVRSITGSDSSIINFTYDAQRRLVLETTVGVSSGNSLNGTLKVNRNSTGIILTTVQKSDALTAAGVDSILTTFYYNSANSKYTAATSLLDIGGFTVTDSVEFTYDGTGKISADKHWFVTGLIAPFEALSNAYSYSATGTNLLTIVQSAPTAPGLPSVPVSTQTFTYDAKTNPLILKNEAILLNRYTYFSANNSTKVDFVDQTDPTNNFTTDNVYKYNFISKPDSCTSTQSNTGALTVSKFYYQ